MIFEFMKNLGELIKELREKKDWPQRKLAYELDIDVSVLSKIETDNRFPRKRVPAIIKTVSRLFGVPVSELRKYYLSDEIADLLIDESDFEGILRVSEEKLVYSRKQKK